MALHSYCSQVWVYWVYIGVPTDTDLYGAMLHGKCHLVLTNQLGPSRSMIRGSKILNRSGYRELMLVRT